MERRFLHLSINSFQSCWNIPKPLGIFLDTIFSQSMVPGPTAHAQMKALLINQYFYPDMAATAQLLTDLAVDLTANGWEVTALAGRGSYAAGNSRPLVPRENWCGIHVRRVWCTNFGRRSSIRRMADYLTYLVSAFVFVAFSRRYDVMVCLSTPPLIAILGLLGKLRGSRFIYKAEDVYPDIAVALGTLRPGILTRCLEFLSDLITAKADRIVALDPSMAQRLAQRGARRIEVIPNWADGDKIQRVIKGEAEARKGESLSENTALTVLYSGNFGLAHRFDAIVSAAQKLAERQHNVRFLFVGGGTRLEEVKSGTSGLTNVLFMDYQPRESLNELYSIADIQLVSLRDETAELQVPSKYSAALASGKAVLLVGGRSGNLSKEIEAEGVGWVCDHNPDQIVDAIMEAIYKPEKVRAMGSAGRKLFEGRYDRRICTEKWIELVNSLVSPIADKRPVPTVQFPAPDCRPRSEKAAERLEVNV
jgi:colanic acid biosynthesis glycosyl transferase WcaI